MPWQFHCWSYSDLCFAINSLCSVKRFAKVKHLIQFYNEVLLQYRKVLELKNCPFEPCTKRTLGILKGSSGAKDWYIQLILVAIPNYSQVAICFPFKERLPLVFCLFIGTTVLMVFTCTTVWTVHKITVSLAYQHTSALTPLLQTWMTCVVHVPMFD